LIGTISRDWRGSLAGLVRGARQHLLICSPFVGLEGARFVTENIPAAFAKKGRVTFLTNLSVKNLCQTSTDPLAIKSVVDHVPRSSVFHLPGLHAKAYIADESCAIITSGNLTGGGLYRNYEYGVQLTDAALVRQIGLDLSDFAQLGVEVPQSRLAAYCDVVRGLYESIRQAQRSAQNAIRQRFHKSLDRIEEDLIQLRLEGGPIHAVFSRTIEYLLRVHGPLATVQIHPMISSLHPDLCDDTVDRVIDGKRFGKKWKHAARTAQQQLKKQGKIVYGDGTWRLA